MKCVTYIYICDHLMWSKGLGVFPSRMWSMWRVDMWGSQPSQPSWTPAELDGTCFLQRQVSLFTTQQPPFLTSPRLVMEGFILPITIPVSWIIPVLHSVRWVPAGHDCRHRWVPRPVMASICHCALASVCFLYCFSFCLSSFSLSIFFPWKCPTGTERRWYKGSSVIPINTEQVSSPSWRSTFSLNGYCKVEYYKVKMNTF